MEKLVRLVRALVAEVGLEPRRVDAPAAAFDRAISQFAQGQWSRAFAELVPLADSGRGDAARIALLMSAHGPRLFGQRFDASSLQRGRWQEAAGRIDTGTQETAAVWHRDRGHA